MTLMDGDVKKLLDDWKSELQGLRNSVALAEARLFRRAAAIESSLDASLWREHCGSFDSFLETIHACMARRYRDFMAAVECPDVAIVADDIGVHAAIQAGKIADREQRAKFLESAAVRREIDGTILSERQAIQVRVAATGAEPRDTKWNREASEMSRLRAKVIEQEQEIRRLTSELESAREELNRIRVSAPQSRRASVRNGSHDDAASGC